MRLRKNMKRTAAAVLALSMAVSAAAAPASAAYICDVSKGNVEISRDGSYTSITVGGKKVNDNGDGTNDIIITGDNTKPTATESLNAAKENADEAEGEAENAGENTSEVEKPTEAEKSGENTSEVEKSGETKTEGKDKTQEPADEGEGKDDEPTTQELLAPEDEQKKTEEKKDEQKPTETQETEQAEKPADTVIEYGSYDPEAQQEATKLEAKPVVKEKSYEDNAATTLSEKAQAAANNVVKIINKSTEPLKVFLRNLKVDAGNTAENAVTVSGTGNVTLELDGKNELTGGTGFTSYEGLGHAGAGLRAEGKGTTTIEDSDDNGSLVATGGKLIVSEAMEKSSYAASGRGIDGAEIAGGNIIGKGGDITNDVSDSNSKFFGAGSGILTKKISGGIVEATGGNVTGIDGNSYLCAGNGLGGDGYGNAYYGPIEISGGTVKATGGNVSINRTSKVEDDYGAPNGVLNHIKVSGGTLIARGGNGKACKGGKGLGEATISDGSVTAIGGDGKEGGNGIGGATTITGGKVTAEGGKGENKKGNSLGNEKVTGPVTLVKEDHTHQYSDGGIVKEATCTSEGYKLKKCSCGAEEMERIEIDKDAHNWVEYGHQDATYTSEGYTIYKCANCGETEKRDVVPMLVPESNGGSSAVTLTVTGAEAYETSIADGRYTVAVPAETAVLSGSLGNLKELKAQGADTIVFRTQLRETALNIDSMLSLGVDDTLFTLTHNGESAELTVGGFAHNELLH